MDVEENSELQLRIHYLWEKFKSKAKLKWGKVTPIKYTDMKFETLEERFDKCFKRLASQDNGTLAIVPKNFEDDIHSEVRKEFYEEYAKKFPKPDYISKEDLEDYFETFGAVCMVSRDKYVDKKMQELLDDVQKFVFFEDEDITKAIEKMEKKIWKLSTKNDDFQTLFRVCANLQKIPQRITAAVWARLKETQSDDMNSILVYNDATLDLLFQHKACDNPLAGQYAKKFCKKFKKRFGGDPSMQSAAPEPPVIGSGNKTVLKAVTKIIGRRNSGEGLEMGKELFKDVCVPFGHRTNEAVRNLYARIDVNNDRILTKMDLLDIYAREGRIPRQYHTTCADYAFFYLYKLFGVDAKETLALGREHVVTQDSFTFMLNALLLEIMNDSETASTANSTSSSATTNSTSSTTTTNSTSSTHSLRADAIKEMEAHFTEWEKLGKRLSPDSAEPKDLWDERDQRTIESFMENFRAEYKDKRLDQAKIKAAIGWLKELEYTHLCHLLDMVSDSAASLRDLFDGAEYEGVKIHKMSAVVNYLWKYLDRIRKAQ